VKKLFFGLIIFVLLLPVLTLALEIENPLSTDSFTDLLDAITKFIIGVGLALTPVMFVVAGFMWVTSAGDPGRTKTAQNIALYTVIGLAVIILASGLVKVLQSILETA